MKSGGFKFKKIKNENKKLGTELHLNSYSRIGDKDMESRVV